MNHAMRALPRIRLWNPLAWNQVRVRGSSLVSVACTVSALLLSGCVSLPEPVERTPSSAFDRPDETSLGRFFSAEAAKHPGKSGFVPVRNSRNAFMARVGLADLAERGLDVQYYIWEADTTGRILALKLIDAADRGVRVRALIDDSNFKAEFGIGALDAHPNIEVRVFNPFGSRGGQAWGYLTDFGRLNHRMHNKVMIADGAIAVVGGRNIGDHYFGVNAEANFRDLDIAAAGPIVADIASSFDMYWNSEWTYPIAGIAERNYSMEDLAQFRTQLEAAVAEAPYPYPIDAEVARLRGELGAIVERFVWAQGEVVADDPGTLTAGDGGVVKTTLQQRLGQAQEEVLIESAYFVPIGKAPEHAGKLVDRGVRIRVLTNSLASNDVAAAHAGYEEVREELLDKGLELYELRPDAGKVRSEWQLVSGRSIAALHTKALVIDRQSTFIGSFNLDPRSANLNTEVGLLVESPELAARVAAYMDEGVLPENSYRVTRDDNGDLVWTTISDGQETTFDKEPETSGWKRFVADFIKILPVEKQL